MPYDRTAYWENRLSRIRDSGTIAQGARRLRWHESEATITVRGEDWQVGYVARLYRPARAVFWCHRATDAGMPPNGSRWFYAALDGYPEDPYQEFIALLDSLLVPSIMHSDIIRWVSGGRATGRPLLAELTRFRRALLSLRRRRNKVIAPLGSDDLISLS